MTPEQLAMEVARMGIYGTVIGVVVGGLIGFLSSLVSYSLQQRNEREKEIQDILNGRLIEIEDYLAKIVEQALKITYIALKLAKSEGTKEDFVTSRDDLMNSILKNHVITASSVLSELDMVDLISTFHEEVKNFFSISVGIAYTSSGYLDFLKKAEKPYTKIFQVHGEIKSKIDSYKLKQLGYKEKTEKKSIFRIFRRKPKALPQSS